MRHHSGARSKRALLIDRRQALGKKREFSRCCYTTQDFFAKATRLRVVNRILLIHDEAVHKTTIAQNTASRWLG